MGTVNVTAILGRFTVQFTFVEKVGDNPSGSCKDNEENNDLYANSLIQLDNSESYMYEKCIFLLQEVHSFVVSIEHSFT